MYEFLKQALKTTLVLALPLALISDGLSAQEPEAAAPQCTAQVDPVEIAAGEAAIKVTAALSEAIGEISGLQVPEGSGIAIAAADAIPRAELANPDAEAQEPKPIEMAAESNAVTLWLSTADAAAGEYEVTLQGESSQCTAKITVRAAG